MLVRIPYARMDQNVQMAKETEDPDGSEGS